MCSHQPQTATARLLPSSGSSSFSSSSVSVLLLLPKCFSFLRLAAALLRAAAKGQTKKQTNEKIDELTLSTKRTKSSTRPTFHDMKLLLFSGSLLGQDHFLCADKNVIKSGDPPKRPTQSNAWNVEDKQSKTNLPALQIHST